MGCPACLLSGGVRRLEGTSGGEVMVGELPRLVKVSHQPGESETLHVKKVDSVLFIAMVINCTVEAEKYKKIVIIVNAAEHFWRLRDFSRMFCHCRSLRLYRDLFWNGL